jgi:membrane-bound metal-dependent hydrolase YbcI (DUF457 family)
VAVTFIVTVFRDPNDLGERARRRYIPPVIRRWGKRPRHRSPTGIALMAGFKMHIGTSTVLGIGYAAAAYFLWDMPIPACVLSAGLCGASGMLPDIDSDTGVPRRESMAFAAAAVPMLMIDRFHQMGLSFETIALAGMGIYLGIRFGVAALIGKLTVHRGMWHSLPAAAIAGLLAFVVCASQQMDLRLLKAGAVVLGYMSHLALDEIYSIDLRRGLPRLKKSFGTALKLWSPSPFLNIATYGQLTALVALSFGDPVMMEQFPGTSAETQQTATDATHEPEQEATPREAGRPAATLFR